MPRIKKYPVELWTYGTEHELSDWDCNKNLPNGFQRSPDYTIVNSNGIAAQPNPKVYQYGGEINTPPTETIEGQVKCLAIILNQYRNCSINYRSNLHLHIRVPGLKDDLRMLKQIQEYIHIELSNVIDLIEPIPKGNTAAERKREKRRKVSHHTFLTHQRLKHQLDAKTVQEFFEREVPATKVGKPMWHAQPRLAVGLRQLLQTDTIEFRHFPGTLSLGELERACYWCQQFLHRAINGFDLSSFVQEWDFSEWPSFPDFNFDLEVGYQATASHNRLKQSEIRENIDIILQGEFRGSKAEAEAIQRANGEA